MDEAAPFRVHREMGCTRAELVAALTAAATKALRIVEDGVMLDVEQGTVRVAMQERPPRRIGALVLPVLQVELLFDRVSEPAREAFLQRFELYTRRGGG